MDELTVIADERAPNPPAGAVVVRFAGMPGDGEVEPPDLVAVRDRAASVMKAQFGPWLFRWIKDSGGLDLAHWEGGLSWWWYAPASERSPLRGELVVRTHELVMLKELLATHRPRRLVWYDSLPAMRRPIADLARTHGCAFKFISCGRQPLRRRLFGALLLCLYAAVVDVARWVLFCIHPPDASQGPPPKILFATRFPRLWEIGEGGARERMFGRLPEFFERSGLPVAYAALIGESPIAWLRSMTRWHGVMASKHVHPIHTAGTVFDVLGVHVLTRFWWRYLRWRGVFRARPAMIVDVNVTDVLRHDLDLAVLDPDMASARLLARNLPKLLEKLPDVRCVLHPFEYQPIEKSVAVGANTGRRVTVVGLQTGVFTSGQLGFLPNPEELRSIGDGPSDGSRAPLPDLLVTYGTLMADLYRPVMRPDGVLNAGALRYGDLAAVLAGDGQAAKPPAEGAGAMRSVLVACSSVPDEAWPMARAAIAVAAEHTDVRLVFKFHYHLQIGDKVAVLAREAIPGRWSIADDGLHTLIDASDAVMTGASSVAYEALALKRPVLIYTPPARWICTPASETPEGFLFWSGEQDLCGALNKALQTGDETSEDKRRSALDKQLALRTDGEQILLDALGPCLAGMPV